MPKWLLHGLGRAQAALRLGAGLAMLRASQIARRFVRDRVCAEHASRKRTHDRRGKCVGHASVSCLSIASFSQSRAPYF